MYSRGKVASCAPGFGYISTYWWSRHPAKVPPTWNVVKLFDPISWLLIFLSILIVSIFLIFSARVGTSYFEIKTTHLEIVLSPFR